MRVISCGSGKKYKQRHLKSNNSEVNKQARIMNEEMVKLIYFPFDSPDVVTFPEVLDSEPW